MRRGKGEKGDRKRVEGRKRKRSIRERRGMNKVLWDGAVQI